MPSGKNRKTEGGNEKDTWEENEEMKESGCKKQKKLIKIMDERQKSKYG